MFQAKHPVFPNAQQSTFVDPTGYSVFMGGVGKQQSITDLTYLLYLASVTDHVNFGQMIDLLGQIELNTALKLPGPVPQSPLRNLRSDLPPTMGSSLFAFGHTNLGDGYLTNAESTAYALYDLAPDGLPDFESPTLAAILAQSQATNFLMGSMLDVLHRMETSTSVDRLMSLLTPYLQTELPQSLGKTVNDIQVSDPIKLGDLLARALISTNPLRSESGRLYFTNVPYLSSNSLASFNYNIIDGEVFAQPIQPNWPSPSPEITQSGLTGVLGPSQSSYPDNLDPIKRMHDPSAFKINIGTAPTQLYLHSLVVDADASLTTMPLV